ncbi:hypothetical protein GC173_01080 [bacterium]|nr:hypothetical protein [bacterium]
MAPNPHLSMPNRIAVCREYAHLWQAFFQFFSDDLSEVQITEQMEKEFEGLIGILALNNYKFQELCGEFMKDPGEVIKILAEAGNLSTLKAMPEATFSKLQIAWHTAFIDMNRALGKMIARLTKKEMEAMQMADSGQQPAA